jgi:large subunit ribosomal protein L6
MSRIGKWPIPIPEKVHVAVHGQKIKVQGPLGELERELPPSVSVATKDQTLVISIQPSGRKDRALYGMVRARVANMVTGVHRGFQKNLEILGLGFKANLIGDKLALNIGFSHPVEFSIPKGVRLDIDKKMTKMTIQGIDKDLVGQVAAQIRALKLPEPYKGTGIRYEGERIHRKAGKTAAGVGAGAGGTGAAKK